MNQATGTIIALMVGAFLLMGATAKARFVTPVRGKISSPYGRRKHPISGKWQLHKGVDIVLPVGTKIKSPASGKVVNLYRTEAGGRQLIVQHDNGYVSGYAHLSKSYFVKGDRVGQGEVIAASGNTGNITGAHLHFSWRKNGKYRNPENTFRF